MLKKLFIGIIIIIMSASLFTACGSNNGNNPSGENKNGAEESSDNASGNVETLYLFNAKGENAAGFEAMCNAFTKETGIPTKAFSVGSGEDSDEPLRAQMNSSNPPAIYTLQALRALPEWLESGRVLDLSTVDDEEFKSIVNGIPNNMRLSDDGVASYGIPYGVEGIGYIVDSQMLADLFGSEAGESVLQELQTCSYDDFKALCEAVDEYIAAPSALQVTLNGNVYTLQAEKNGLAKNLTGVFAFPGSEKWVYADHLLNMPMSTIAKMPADAKNATNDSINAAKSAFKAYAEALDFITSHAAGLKGHATRGQELINSANFGYDQTIQMYADGNALFIQQGNWAASNIAKISQEVENRSSFIPLKMPFTDDMIQDGRTAKEINSSIIVTTGNYYAINAKTSKTVQKEAVQFLTWMMKPENVQHYIVDSFNFIPYNAGKETKLKDALATSIQNYLASGKTINDTVVGTPKTWSGENVGTALLEKYLITPDWTEETYDDIASLCVEKWIELKEE